MKSSDIRIMSCMACTMLFALSQPAFATNEGESVTKKKLKESVEALNKKAYQTQSKLFSSMDQIKTMCKQRFRIKLKQEVEQYLGRIQHKWGHINGVKHKWGP